MKQMRKKELLESLQKEKLEGDAEGTTSGEKNWIEINPATSRRVCTLCDVEFSSTILELTHLHGRRHQANLKKYASGQHISFQEEKGMLKKCEVCNVRFTSQEQMFGHFSGRRHIQRCKSRGKQNIQLGTKKTLLDPSSKANATAAPEVTPVEVQTEAPVISVMKTEEADEENKKVSTVFPPQEVQAASENQPLNTSSEPSATVTPKVSPVEVQTEAPVEVQTEAHVILEKQAEEAYEAYKKVATVIPPQEAQALYLKYQALYKEYDAAYREYMRSKQVKEFAVQHNSV